MEPIEEHVAEAWGPGQRAPRVLIVKNSLLKGRRYHLELRTQGIGFVAVYHGRQAVEAFLAGGFDAIIIETCDNPDEAPPVDSLLPLEILSRYIGDAHAPIVLLSPRPAAWTEQRRARYNIQCVWPQNVCTSACADLIRQIRGLLGTGAVRQKKVYNSATGQFVWRRAAA